MAALRPHRGGVYRIRSRNSTVAVYRGYGAWLGVREKFGERYVEVFPATLVEEVLTYITDVPPGMELTDVVGPPYCQGCGGNVSWSQLAQSWVCTSVVCTAPCPAVPANSPLLRFLEEYRLSTEDVL